MDVLLAGHITKDITPEGREVLGGPVSFAGITLAKRNHSVTIATIADPESPLLDELRRYGIEVINFGRTDEVVTTFVNRYDQLGNRQQHVHEVARPFDQEQINQLTNASFGRQKVMILPVANEIPYEMYTQLHEVNGNIIAAPQGSLRRWDAQGKVYHVPFDDDYLDALRFCQLVTISREDMEGFSLSQTQRFLEQSAQTIVVTDGMHGASIYFQNGPKIDVPAFQLTDGENRRGFLTGNGDHMTAIIAERSPFPNGSNPEIYQSHMMIAVAQAAFETALKIIPRRGIEDGTMSIRTAEDVRSWSQTNIDRVRSYARQTNIDIRNFYDPEISRPKE